MNPATIALLLSLSTAHSSRNPDVQTRVIFHSPPSRLSSLHPTTLDEKTATPQALATIQNFRQQAILQLSHA
jgi:hypothetical protein